MKINRLRFIFITQLSLIQKEESIKNLKDKILLLEVEEQDLANQDILKRTEDLEFYRRSYEEQKNRVNKEHEMISSSLYELALQFMSLKNELQKKMVPDNSTISKK